nr:hypothetical protein [Tanacetum cinerariifolium]
MGLELRSVHLSGPKHPDSDSGKWIFKSLMKFNECNSELNGIRQSDGSSFVLYVYMSVVSVLNTPISDDGDDATVQSKSGKGTNEQWDFMDAKYMAKDASNDEPNNAVEEKLISAFCDVVVPRLPGLLQFWSLGQTDNGIRFVSCTDQPFALEDLDPRHHFYRNTVEEKDWIIENSPIATAFLNGFQDVVLDLREPASVRIMYKNLCHLRCLLLVSSATTCRYEELNNAVEEKLISAFCDVAVPRLPGLLQFWSLGQTDNGIRFVSCTGQPFALEDLDPRHHFYRLACIKFRCNIDHDDNYDPYKRNTVEEKDWITENSPIANAFLNGF